MLYKDALHPLNVVWLAYDVLCVVVRSFSPETLVRKRPKKKRVATDAGLHHRHHSYSSRRSGSASSYDDASRSGRQALDYAYLGSQMQSQNTSFQTPTTLNSSGLPPPVPTRAVTAVLSARTRTRSHSGDTRREGVPEGDRPKSFLERLRDWRSIDVTRATLLLLHVLRAMPVVLLHFFTQLRTDAATLELLRFDDLRATAVDLMIFDENAIFVPEFGWDFIITRCLLSAAQQYALGRVCLETNFVVLCLRSRRTHRRLIGWALRLASHTLIDPITCSVVSSMLLCTVRDYSPVTGPLRYTPRGLCAAVTIGFMGAVLDLLIVPTATIYCQRVVVCIYEGSEYILTRRYATRDLMRHEAADGYTSSCLDSIAVSEDDREAIHTASLVGEGVSADHSRLHRRHVDPHCEGEETHLPILRAIIFRVVGVLVSHCLVQHPLGVLSRMLYSRAVLHSTGLLEAYANSSTEVISLSSMVDFFRLSAYGGSSSSGVPALEALRCIGSFLGQEASLIRGSILRCSGQEAGISRLLAQVSMDTEENVVTRASAWESVEMLTRCIASTSPLFKMLYLTSVDKLLTFYMDMWVRLRGD
uniref:WGS project CAEQ00000000 data, annotated contig 1533 n=1 Tax=Trypanosoma congolense (strain IL3000) TaxID=1068625 RepID=F9W6Y0_TRYCI|nr:unnamed protein product [Trypanosoma congolense IL3000]